MAAPRKRTLPKKAPALPPPPKAEVVAVVDIGASALRLLVAEVVPGQPIRILDDVTRGVLLGKDTFTHGRLGQPSVEAALKALEGFRRIMDSYGVERYRAVATSAVREAQNRDAFLDRVRVRTGIDVEIIDGSEENRLGYMAIRDRLKDHEALTGDALVVEVGGGSADLSFLRKGEPIRSGTYALGSIRIRQGFSDWQGPAEQLVRLVHRHVHNVVEDIKEEMPLGEATHFIALGGDVRHVAVRLGGGEPTPERPAVIPRDAFLAWCDQVATADPDQLADTEGLPVWEAETLVPALLAYRDLLLETKAAVVVVPDASLRTGLLLDLARADDSVGIEAFSKQVFLSAAALGEKYRYDAAHGDRVADLAGRLFDQLKAEHGLSARHRLLLQVAGVLHDIGIFVALRGHHKHSWYLLSSSEIFGLSRDDMAVVANVARYHRRALPQKSHLPYMALDRETRVEVNKMAALLRLANACDADHLQKVRDVRVVAEGGEWTLELEGTGDLTMERLAVQARADMASEVFGRRIAIREKRG